MINPVLNQNVFFVREHYGFGKASNNFDIHDPESRDLLMTCREENLNIVTKMFRFTDYKRYTPFDFEIRSNDGDLVMNIKRGIALLVSKVEVFDANENLVGVFNQKLLSIGGKFDVCDANNNVLCTLSGKWTGWDFQFVKDGVEFARVTKKWKGLGQEMFTSADNYVLSINDTVPQDNPVRILILAAVLCIDMVLKE